MDKGESYNLIYDVYANQNIQENYTNRFSFKSRSLCGNICGFSCNVCKKSFFSAVVKTTIKIKRYFPLRIHQVRWLAALFSSGASQENRHESKQHEYNR